MNFSPMLACNETYDLRRDIRLPCAVSPKYDGIRVLHHAEGWLTRTNKPIPSKQANEYLTGLKLPPYVDAELLIYNHHNEVMSYNDIQSYVMSQDKPLPARHQWSIRIFDYFKSPRDPYHYRILELHNLLSESERINLIAPSMPCDTYERLEYWCKEFSQHYEGAMIRRLDAPYKYGRSTLREQFLVKYILRKRAEGIIIGATENTEHSDRIGALLVYTDDWGTLRIGTGYSLELSREFRKGMHKGKLCTFEFKPHGMKNIPRQPAFVGFRAEEDL